MDSTRKRHTPTQLSLNPRVVRHGRYSVADNSRYNKETFVLRANVSLTKVRSKSVYPVAEGGGVGEPPEALGMLGLTLSQENSGLY